MALVVLALCCCTSSVAAGGFFAGVIPGTEKHFLKEVKAVQLGQSFDSLRPSIAEYKEKFNVDEETTKKYISGSHVDASREDFQEFIQGLDQDDCTTFTAWMDKSKKLVDDYPQGNVLTTSGMKKAEFEVLYPSIETTFRDASMMKTFCSYKSS
jgi:hypothetical protein